MLFIVEIFFIKEMFETCYIIEFINKGWLAAASHLKNQFEHSRTSGDEATLLAWSAQRLQIISLRHKLTVNHQEPSHDCQHRK